MRQFSFQGGIGRGVARCGFAPRLQACGIAAHCLSDPVSYLGICRALPHQGRRRSLATIGTRIMSTFDRRTEAFEKKFALDEERRFKAEVRRNRLLGFWAAERLGITGDAAATYANEVVAADLEEAGDADVVRKIMGDLAAKGAAEGAAVTEQAIRAKMNDFTAQALAEVNAAK